MKKTRVSATVKGFLEGAGLTELQFLAGIGRHKDYLLLVNYVNKLIDAEKNKFFVEKEFSNEQLATEHAYSRGKISGILEIMYVIEGASDELEARLKESKE